MKPLLAMAEAMLLEKAVSAAFTSAPSNKFEKYLSMLTAALGIGAIWFFVKFFYEFVSSTYNPATASLLTSGALVGLAALAALASASIHQTRQSNVDRIADQLGDLLKGAGVGIKDGLKDAGEALDADYGDFVRRNPASSITMASVAGMVLAGQLKSGH